MGRYINENVDSDQKYFLYILDHNSWLFTAILRDEYSQPPGLCFDYICADPPIMVRSKVFHLFI